MMTKPSILNRGRRKRAGHLACATNWSAKGIASWKLRTAKKHFWWRPRTARPGVARLDCAANCQAFEVCRRLRGRQETRNVPIIMLGRGEETDRIRGLDTGADDYLTKAFLDDRASGRGCARSCARIRPSWTEDVVSVGDIEMDRGAHRVRRAGTEVHLDRRVQAARSFDPASPAGSSPRTIAGSVVGFGCLCSRRAPWTCMWAASGRRSTSKA